MVGLFVYKRLVGFESFVILDGRIGVVGMFIKEIVGVFGGGGVFFSKRS